MGISTDWPHCAAALVALPATTANHVASAANLRYNFAGSASLHTHTGTHTGTLTRPQIWVHAMCACVCLCACVCVCAIVVAGRHSGTRARPGRHVAVAWCFSFCFCFCCCPTRRRSDWATRRLSVTWTCWACRRLRQRQRTVGEVCRPSLCVAPLSAAHPLPYAVFACTVCPCVCVGVCACVCENQLLNV